MKEKRGPGIGISEIILILAVLITYIFTFEEELISGTEWIFGELFMRGW